MREVLRSTIGQKAIMAVTGLIMLGYLVTHVLANLLVFQPAGAGTPLINQYSARLHALGPGLWLARAVLIAAVLAHIWAAYALTRRDRDARPVRYAKYERQAATYASRTIRWGGVLILVFLVLHIMHFTTFTLDRRLVELDPYDNVRTAFASPAVSVAYVVAMLAVGLHLYHGAWSSFKTLGLARAGQDPLQRRASAAVAGLIWLGFTLIPIGILAGLAR